MAVTYVGVTASGYAQDSFSHTLTAGTSRVVVLLLTYGTGAALPANCTFGGTNMTLRVSRASTGTQQDTIVGIYTLAVADEDSGAKTVVVSGGSHGDYHQAWLVELSGCTGGYVQSGSDPASASITLANVLSSSIVLAIEGVDGVFTPSIVTGTLVGAGQYDSMDDRFDWGFAAGRNTGTGNVTVAFSGGGARSIAAVEMTGGTTYTCSVSGSQTLTGALVKMPMKVLAGAQTNTGVVSKLTSKILAGAQTNTGTVTKLMMLQRTVLTGAMTWTGTLTKKTIKVLAGIIQWVGTLVGVGVKEVFVVAAVDNLTVHADQGSLTFKCPPDDLTMRGLED